ncbi:MAG TPA: HAD family hydrolase [Firmicutes bacterium]|nr:HAD family hydrolase [Candidatus Fermentithermobacillaceae bacterium]
MNVRAVLFDLGGTLWSPFGVLGRDEALRLASQAAIKRLQDAGVKELPETAVETLMESVSLRLAGLRGHSDGHLARPVVKPATGDAVGPTAAASQAGLEDLREVDFQEVFLKSVGRLGVTLSAEDARAMSSAFACDLDGHYQVFPDVIPALSRLRQEFPGLKVGIVSNTSIPEQVIDRHVNEAGIQAFTDFRVFSSTVGWRKPHRAIYAKALELAGTAPEDTVFVGDRLLEDVIGPKSMGMKALLRTHGDPVPDDVNACDAVISDLRYLVEVLPRIS